MTVLFLTDRLGLLKSGLDLLTSGLDLLTSGLGLLTSGLDLLTSGLGLLTLGLVEKCLDEACCNLFLNNEIVNLSANYNIVTLETHSHTNT